MSSDSMGIELRSVGKSFTNQAGRSICLLQNCSVQFVAKRISIIMGRSGCGKSTLLRMISGLDTDYSGHISIDGRGVSRPSRRVMIVGQEPALLEWKSLLHNLLFATDDADRESRVRRAEHMLEQLGLTGYEEAFPSQVSGGMRQRLALGMAFLARPQVLLLDEPLNSLDGLTKLEIMQLLLEMQRALQMTIVLVTHDVNEAAVLADDIYFFSRDNPVQRIELLDSPRISSSERVKAFWSDPAGYKETLLKRLFGQAVDQSSLCTVLD